MKARRPRRLTDSEKRLVESNRGWVRDIAIHVAACVPIHIPVEDLASAGVLGLIDAAMRYDPARLVPFHPYAKARVRGAMMDYLRTLDWLSRGYRTRLNKIEKATEELHVRLRREPTDEEIAAHMGIRLKDWHAFTFCLYGTEMSLAFYDGDGLEQLDHVGDPALWTDRLVYHEELRRTLRSALAVLPPRYRAALDFYYIDGLTMKEIGHELGINESRVSQIHTRALELLKATLEKRGIPSLQAFGAAA